MSQKRILDQKKPIKPKPEDKERAKKHPSGKEVSNLQHLVGNRAIQRLLTQRSEDGSAELDEDTASRVNQERGGGQPLMGGVQEQMGTALGYDLSSVHVHTSPEADSLNRELGAKAFTTGQDIFFREGAYEPHSSGGQELIAHELTHVVQQETGAVRSSGSRMMVNAPGDAFEQEADAVSQTVNRPQIAADVQRQEEEEEIQLQEEPEEEEEAIQMQVEEEEEEEEALQMQEEEEEEEEELMP